MTFSMRVHASAVQFVEPVHTVSRSRITYLLCMRSGMPGIAVAGTDAASRASNDGPAGGDASTVLRWSSL